MTYQYGQKIGKALTLASKLKDKVTDFPVVGGGLGGLPKRASALVDRFIAFAGSNNSPYLEFYRQEQDNRTLILGQPDTGPADDRFAVDISANGNYICAVGGISGNEIGIYKRDKFNFTLLTTEPDVQVSGTGLDCHFSSDNTYLAAVGTNTPYVYIYKRSGDDFTKLANPSTLPTNITEGCAFSNNLDYLAVCGGGAIIYKRSIDTFTALGAPFSGGEPPTALTDVCWSSDNTYLAFGRSVSTFLYLYKRSGDTFTKLADPSILPTGGVNSLAFSPDGNYLVVGHATTPFITIYKRSGDLFTKLANPATLPPNSLQGVAFSGDGKYLHAARQGLGAKYMTYERIGDSFVLLPNPDVAPTSIGQGIACFPRAFEGIVRG